jgi:hypothetical protein
VTKAPFKSNVKSNERSVCDSNSVTTKKVKQVMFVIKLVQMKGGDHLKDILKIHSKHTTLT